jgi:hypothetical protein
VEKFPRLGTSGYVPESHIPWESSGAGRYLKKKSFASSKERRMAFSDHMRRKTM